MSAGCFARSTATARTFAAACVLVLGSVHGVGRAESPDAGEPAAGEALDPNTPGNARAGRNRQANHVPASAGAARGRLERRSEPAERTTAMALDRELEPQVERASGPPASNEPAAAASPSVPEHVARTEDELDERELDPDTVTKLLARYAHEPSALEVARMALRAAEQDPERLESLADRARLRGLVPSLALGARRGQGVDLRATLAEDDDAHFTSGDDLVLSATLRFELGRLLFAEEEVAIAREARATRAARQELARTVIHSYFVRRRLQLQRDLRAHTSLGQELRIAELEALLDSFTNGAFRRMIRSRREWTTGASTPATERP